MNRTHLILTLVFALAIFPASQAAAAHKAQAFCAQAPVNQFVSTLSEWHAQLSGLAAAGEPSLGEVASLRSRMETLALDLQRRRFLWAARHDPERLTIRRSVPEALQMAWSDKDEKQLRTAEPEYQDASEQWHRVDQAERRHPRRDQLQRAFETTVLGSEEYRRLTAQLVEKVQPINAAFLICGQMKPRQSRSLTE